MMNKIVNKLINKMKNKIVPLILSIIAVVSILSQTTYSLLFKEYETEEQNFALGTLEITSNKNVDSVTLTNSLPIEDSEGKETAPYIFTITNVGNLIYQFDVKFLSTTTTNMINSKYIKIMVDDNEPVVLNSLTDGIILEDITLKPEESIEISLRAWLDINTSNTEIGKVFNGKIVTEGIAVDDMILVTDEYIESNKTTEIVPINLEYTTPKRTEVTLNAGTYKLEVWGAQGGSDDEGDGGLGGYSYGTLTLTEETNVYVYVGGQGKGGTSTGLKAGGFNGGGSAYSSSSAYVAGSGGGASDIRIGQNSLYARVIVAGGGGGFGSYSNGKQLDGGVGGGTSGGTGSRYSASYRGGGGGSTESGGVSYYGTTADSTTYGKLAIFGTGGSSNSTSYNGIAGGGGGWYGGGYAWRASGGGGSGYVYTSETASNYPSGVLLNSSYYLTDAATINGKTRFTDFDGTSGIGHSGNGAVRISGKEVVDGYAVPRLLGLTDLTIAEGASVNLTKNLTLECETGTTTCSLIGPSITNTSSLAVGSHTIYYYVIGSDNKKYKFSRNITIFKSSLTISNILVNNITNQGIPTTGLYSLTSNNCSNVSYDRFAKKVKISDFTTAQSCDLNFTTDTNYPFLNTMQVGDYVAYVGNNGCLSGASGITGTGAAESGNSCKGYNANQPTDGTEDSNGSYGHCFGYSFTTYGWRIAYIEDGKVHLISAGSPECRTRTESNGNATAITDLNTAALDYCNATYVDGGKCPTTASESNAVRALGNTDFEKITNAISGTSSSLTSAYGSTQCFLQYSYKRCGYGNDLMVNGGRYWFAAANGNSTNGVIWWSSYVSATPLTSAYGLRPIIRLSSSVYVTGGSGTMEDPYTIGI